jgi:transposase
LNVATGEVFGQCYARHRQQEFVKFLKLLDAKVPEEEGVTIHLILDNYATHKTPTVKRWLKKHPRFVLHFTPTSSSWINQIERFFAAITEQCIRRGAFLSVKSLEKAILDYIDHHNPNHSSGPPTPTSSSNASKTLVIKLTNQDTSVLAKSEQRRGMKTRGTIDNHEQKREKDHRPPLQNSHCNQTLNFGSQFGKSRTIMRPERGKGHLSTPQLPVQRAIPDGLGDVILCNAILIVEVGNGTGNPQDTVVGSGREAEVVDGGAEQFRPSMIELAMFADRSSHHATVEH